MSGVFSKYLPSRLARALESSRWGYAIVALWLLLALVGAGNLLLRLRTAPAPAPAAPNTGFGPQADAQGGIVPVRLIIPTLGVDAPVEKVGLTKEGAMQTPSGFGSTAWYKNGSEPGAPGNAVIDGHVNNALTQAGVFEHLDQLHLGDSLQVADAAGNTRAFTVKDVQVYGADQAPTSEIFATSGPAQLVLITCDGVWDPAKKEFDRRLVVYASLAS